MPASDDDEFENWFKTVPQNANNRQQVAAATELSKAGVNLNSDVDGKNKQQSATQYKAFVQHMKKNKPFANELEHDAEKALSRNDVVKATPELTLTRITVTQIVSALISLETKLKCLDTSVYNMLASFV